VNLATYPIVEPDDYRVVAQMRIHDAFPANGTTPPRALADFEPVDVQSDEITLHVVGGGEPMLTFRRIHQSNIKAQPPDARADIQGKVGSPKPNIVGAPTQPQINAIHSAHAWAARALLPDCTS
jgi:hypothetical protein